MNIKQAMIKTVSVCSPDDNLAQVAAILWNDGRGVLPVVDHTGAVTGVITDRDIAIALGTRNAKASEVYVRDVILPRVFTCGTEEDVHHALQTMVAQNVRRLPVVDERDGIVGILSLDDLIRVAEEAPRPGGVSYRDVIQASKEILESRTPGHAHPAAELVATHN